MQLLQYATSFLAISQLLLLAMIYLAYYRKLFIGRLMVLYAACLIGYILSTLPEVNAGPEYVDTGLGIVAIASPFLLWLITRFLFVDNPRIHPAIWALFGAYMVLRSVGMMTGPHEGLSFLILLFIPQAVMLGFACHVVYMAVRGRGGDLVEPRRKLRVPFAITMGAIVAIIVSSGFFYWNSPWILSVYIGAIFLCILFFNLATFRLHRDSPQLIDTRPEGSVAPLASRIHDKDKDKPLIDRVHAAMENDRLYAQTGLTIGVLAQVVSMPEYRLRRLINQRLHYRNFNQYLNQYRIDEAARRLLDQGEAHIPISTIALDVGYSSLSSFNKAFKEAHGVTPSIYRGRALG
ncbi:MAG: helix-turn-helix domain-containing protein [Pseudohongiellaceae bacterium]|nr:helix-turn-helix domain-containing protein [Pseudohongiellaceae bacterium]